MRNWLCIVTLMAACAADSRGAGVPFILPWDDALPGVATDFSGMNTPIDGEARVSADASGHFAARGQRVRFIGVNFAGDSPFMPTNKADAVAARLAKFGVNCVRFHHMDASWAYNGGLLSYSGTSSMKVSASQLQRVQYLVARLKAHGIYSDINLLVAREYRSGDGLGAEATTMDWKDAHILGFFNDTALGLHKDYATQLLTPANPFTGMTLAKDPAVAFVEILNENGIVQKWFDGGLDRLPKPYAAQLQARWNRWLSERYTNEAPLLAAWQAIDQPLGANMLKNGAFSNAVASWNGEQHNTAKAVFSRTLDFTGGGPSAKINVTATSDADWHIQFNQAGLRVTNQQCYTLSFWAKSSPGTNFSATVMRAYGDYAGVGYIQTFALTTNWQQYVQSFQASVTDTNSRVNFGGMGNKLASFWLADVRLQPGGKIGVLPSGASLASGTVPNLIHSGDGYTGSAAARRDWLRFLRDLEYRYYDEMRAHLRGTCGYEGLLGGTIMANSPATVQNRLDYIDGHAYWQHPDFPLQPWDPVNWRVPNISLVNTLDDANTISGLARQRIQGRPFTVTEYNHPQPNYYGSEAPLLLAAYAAYQDWDGFWLFDYGPGQDATAKMGYARGFFDTAQHPGKMANFLLAANLFRRGDIRPANREIVTDISPDREIELLQNATAWSVFSSAQLGVSGKLAFTGRLSTRIVDSNAVPANPPSAPTGSILSSDTGELKWDLSKTSNGVVVIDTPRTKAIAGFTASREFKLGPLTFVPGATQLGWQTWGATLIRGDSFTNDCAALVVAAGWWENTGQVWKDATKNSIGNQWGGPPILMEVVPFKLTLPVAANRVSVWTLDEQGRRKSRLTVTGDGASATIEVATNSATIWHEIEVSRSVAGFESWRQANFTPAELADPSVSSETAAPAGDGVRNLMKYYLGRTAKTFTPSEGLFQGALSSESNQLFLTMTFDRDKAASGVECVAETSDDLVKWTAEPSLAVVASTPDLGSREQVTIRELSPAGGASARFLRLRFTRLY
jgi:hypothetical protein